MRSFNSRFVILAVVFALFFTAIGAAVGVAAQNHMTTARGYLYQAYSELNQATTNKGGHRVNAMNLINQAIHEVNLGIEYANSQ